MRQISEKDLRDSIIAIKKDAKLVLAAKNDRTNSSAGMYREFVKLPLDRQRETINTIAGDYFVAANWKINFPLNNFSATVMPEAVAVAGKALFFSREEDSIREAVRAVKIYQNSPFFKQISAILQDAVEITGPGLNKVCQILTSPEMFAQISSLEPSPASERIVTSIGKIATYTLNPESTLNATRFLIARRYSADAADLATLLENAIFMARDPKSVKEIIEGFTAGSIDVVLRRETGKKEILGAIRDIAWKSKDSHTIRQFLNSLLA
jgi:hypothetical protein